MKKILIISTAILFLSCSQSSSESNSEIKKSDITTKVETYIKASTNNPEMYKPLKTSSLVIVKEAFMIGECYRDKYGPKGINFNRKDTFKIPAAKDIHEPFYYVVHEFNAQNKFGAIIKQTAIVYLDSSNTILFSSTVGN